MIAPRDIKKASLWADCYDSPNKHLFSTSSSFVEGLRRQLEERVLWVLATFLKMLLSKHLLLWYEPASCLAFFAPAVLALPLQAGKEVAYALVATLLGSARVESQRHSATLQVYSNEIQLGRLALFPQFH